jgi:hypothetical protein
MNSTQDIVNSIDTRIRKLTEEINTLTAARSVLDAREQQSSTKRPRRARTQRARAKSARPRTDVPARSLHDTPREASQDSVPRSRERAPRTRRALRAISPDQLESLFSENGGLTTSELAERANTNREQVLRLLRDMETTGRVRRSGQRRGTRWHAITDEDRIRQRIAELEASRRNRD